MRLGRSALCGFGLGGRVVALFAPDGGFFDPTHATHRLLFDIVTTGRMGLSDLDRFGGI